MDFIVKDKNVVPIAVVDLYSEAIWTERYCDVGDFELHLPLNNDYLDSLAIGNYLTLQDSDRAMIIESMEIESDIDTGEKTVLYKGETLETILKRRIVWGIEHYTDSIESIIEQLLRKHAIAPSDVKRKIDNLVWVGVADSITRNYLATLETVDCQFEGDNLFDAVKELCEQFNLGFKIIFSDDGKFEFRLYYGTDRSCEQHDRDPIVFSTEYDTLINSRYVHNMSEFRNVALVEGEERNNVPVYATAYLETEEPTGLDRREMYVSASDLRSEDFGANYSKALQYRGQAELQEKYTVAVFDGEVETSIGPQLNHEYFLGDFISAINEYGLGSVGQITEYIRSYDEKGYSAYPTIVMLN